MSYDDIAGIKDANYNADAIKKGKVKMINRTYKQVEKEQFQRFCKEQKRSIVMPFSSVADHVRM